ncbi:unnamed protein product [Moneuplotes crassus]|uniref:Uncharacterized protein n=1 Tax=Euplotes crassus TaxID=5936 RepID=A0AAD2D0V4_EUPCR|nr:unnamed protein product [Moneuplotes crassus]
MGSCGSNPNNVKTKKRKQLSLAQLKAMQDKYRQQYKDLQVEDDSDPNEVTIDLSTKSDQKFIMVFANGYILPSIDVLKVNNCMNIHQSVSLLLTECVKKKDEKNFIKELYLNNTVNEQSGLHKLEIESYCKPLRVVSSVVTDKIHLWYCSFNSKSFSKILNWCSGVKEISFFKSRINLKEELCFNDEEFESDLKLETLNFYGCGDDNGLPLISEKDIDIIAKAIISSPLLSSIKELIINNCELNKIEVRSILQEHEIEHIVVWD